MDAKKDKNRGQWEGKMEDQNDKKKDNRGIEGEGSRTER